MSHARARAQQLHRQALRAKRVTDRVVGKVQFIGFDGDSHCAACGYRVCSCAAAAPMHPVPVTSHPWCGFCLTHHRYSDVCAPAPKTVAFVTPMGWGRAGPYSVEYGIHGEGGRGPLMVVGPQLQDATYLAMRRPYVGPAAVFDNPYAAMLCALGCEVEAQREEPRWVVRWDRGASRHRDEDLPALVERLTAERAAHQQGERIGRELAAEQH